MNPDELLAPLTPRGLPAPVAFLLFFRVVGFILHLAPMHLVYAGTPLVAVLAWRRRAEARTLAARLGRVLPVAVALAVNFGIVPLLFVQTTHYRVFYPATILMAWPWMLVIAWLITAYYAIYFFAGQVRAGEPSRWAKLWLGLAAVLVVLIGFTFANAMSLTSNVAAWSPLYEQTNVSGAVTGLALNTADPTLPARWLMMFGLAITTVGAWIALDAAWSAGGESDDYRAWAGQAAWRVYAGGLVVFAVCGYLYLVRTIPLEHTQAIFAPPMRYLTLLTGALPGVVLVLVWWRRNRPSAGGAAWVFAGQLLVLALNAVSRQALQNRELDPYFNPHLEQATTQWSTLPLFLVVFVATLGFVAWMLVRVVKESGTDSADWPS